MIDIRCTSGQPGSGHADDTGRCQLFAGHEGPHAVMFCRNGQRIVRIWRHADPATVRDHDAGQETLPWVLGMPQPAWGEIA